MIKNLFLVAFLAVLGTLSSAKRYLTLHNQYRGYNVSSLTIYTNVSDFQAFAPGIAGVAQKICTTGLWITYNDINYKGAANPHPTQNEWDGEVCVMVNHGSQTIASSRYVGPDAEAADGRGLTLFSDPEFEGMVFRVGGPANAFLPFVPKSLLITGSKNPWTLYTGINFNGTATCYGGYNVTQRYAKVNQLFDDAKSVSAGCYN